MSVTVRNYTEADVRALAEAHLAAYRGYMNAGIGAGYVRAFLSYFLSRQDAIAVMAEVDGKPAGYASGLPLGQHTVMNKALFSAYAMGAITHPWVLLRPEYRRSAVAKLKRIFGSPPAVSTTAAGAARAAHVGHGFGLTSIGVSPAFAGRGAGSALLEEFERQARDRGFKSLHLSVYADNGRARKVYERAGWQLISDSDRIVAFQKPLDASATPHA